MSDELKRRRPPPTAYDDPGDAATNLAIELLATKIEEGSNRIAAAIGKLAEAMPRLSSDAKDEN